ncbi:hypothetical protein FACS189434_12570 [Bacteroidia bacterium]|nr:hypothetical protein FACS189434_12570 [Bacteroidia bacterium]
MQTIGDLIAIQNLKKTDKVLLKLKKPIYYNQNCIIHFKTECDDTDKKSMPYVASRVEKETDIIHFRIILKHKPNEFDSNAILERELISSEIRVGYEKIKEIPFDKITKSYEYHLLAPETGYFYRIRWEK